MKSIIWNLTRACIWDCSFCCVAAKKITKKEFDNGKRLNKELDLESKKRVIDELERGGYRIDFSGGELLLDNQNLELISYASDKLGKENIGISISGAFINDEIIAILKEKVNDVEITLDCVPDKVYSSRPKGYHECAARAMIELKNAGIRVGAQTVITRDNMDKNMIRDLFKWLEKNKIDEWSILRFFNVGRGTDKNISPSHKQYVEVVEFIKKITAESKVEVHFQYLLPNHKDYTFQCRAVKKSLGILPDGTVTACFWALDQNMKPINDDFILGKVPEMKMSEILLGNKAKKFEDNKIECAFFDKKRLED